MSKIILWPVLAGGLTTLLLIYWRGFYWQHALIVGVGVAALVYVAFRTYDNLRNLYRR